ncbi:MAG: hypothetical protein WBV39_08390 [Rudaea sp.]
MGAERQTTPNQAKWIDCGSRYPCQARDAMTHKTRAMAKAFMLGILG